MTISAGALSSFGFGLEDGHVPTFWLPLCSEYGTANNYQYHFDGYGRFAILQISALCVEREGIL